MRLSLVALFTTSLLATSAFAQATPPAAVPGAVAGHPAPPPGGPAPTPPGPPPAQGMMGGPGTPPPAGGPLFGEMDTNHDGVITKQEFLSKAEEHFSNMDKNHDGKITTDEGDAARAEMMQKMQAHRAEWEAKTQAGGPAMLHPAAPTPDSMIPPALVTHPAPASIPSAVPVPAPTPPTH